MRYLIILLLLCFNVRAGTTTGTLTATATVSPKIVPTHITVSNGIVITKDLPQGAVINTVKENKNTYKVTIIY
jgi:hypothetical protein